MDAPGHSIAASTFEISQLREGFRDPSYSRLAPVTKDSSREVAAINFYRALHQFLGTFRFYQATDQRDKVIAPLSLALHWAVDALPDDHAARSLVDYTKAPSHLYQRASELMIQHTGELLLLLMVEDPSLRNYADLPSWVPDFSVSMMPILCVTINNLSQRPFIPPASAVVKVGGGVLNCSGGRISEVALVGPGRADLKSSWIPLLLFLSSMGPSCASLNETEVSSVDEFISVAFGGRFDLEPIDQDRHTALFSFLLFAVVRSPEFKAMVDDYQRRLQLESWSMALREIAVALRSQTESSPPTLEVLDVLAKRFPGAVPSLAFATSWFDSRDGKFESDLAPHDKAECGRCVENSEVLSIHFAGHAVATDDGHPGTAVDTDSDEASTQFERDGVAERDAPISAMKAGFEAGFTTHFIKYQDHHEAAFHSRRLFRAASGFIGLMPVSSRVSDEIWTLYGCPAPVILRREADGISHRLVGATFVNLLQGREIQWESQDALKDVRIL